MRRAVAAALLVLAAGLTGQGVGTAVAKPAVLTAAEMRAFGMEALAKGYAQQALEIAEALGQRDPRDSSAYVLKAQALRVLQRLPESEAAARQAWSLAQDAGTRYQAATTVAQALSLQGHRTSAQYWLRQAVQNAPNGAAQAQALQDFNYVRSQNPLSLRLDASLRPSDNVNGGTRVTSFALGGQTVSVPGNLEALSGLTWSLGAQGGYKLAASPTGVTRLIFGMTQQGVVLSKAAQAQAPGARNADYAFSQLSLGVERKTYTDLGQWTLTAEAAHNWYGGVNLSDSLALDLGIDRPLGQGMLSYGATVTRQIRLDRPQSSSTEAELTTETSQSGPQGDRWTGSLSVTRSWSRDARVDHAEAAVGLDWQAAHPVAGVTLGANLGLQAAIYGVQGRRDGRWSTGLTATLDKVGYLGFAPVLSLSMAQTNSNILLHTTRSFGIGLSIRSRF